MDVEQQLVILNDNYETDKITQLERDIIQLDEIFRDLHELVDIQQIKIDNTEVHIDNAKNKVNDAQIEIKQADSYNSYYSVAIVGISGLTMMTPVLWYGLGVKAIVMSMSVGLGLFIYNK